jgi:hypothetical protein
MAQDHVRAAVAASIGTIVDRSSLVSPPNSPCQPVVASSSGTRRGRPRQRVDDDADDASGAYDVALEWSDANEWSDADETDGPSHDGEHDPRERSCDSCSIDRDDGDDEFDGRPQPYGAWVWSDDENEMLGDEEDDDDADFLAVTNDVRQWADDDEARDDEAHGAVHGEYTEEARYPAYGEYTEEVDREKTACFSLRQKNNLTEAFKCRLATSEVSCQAAVDFRCPCGFKRGGQFCTDRVALTTGVVRNERDQTFAVPIRHKRRLKFHAIRLKSHVREPREMTAEVFFPSQHASQFHYFIAGRPVCKEAYGEICALSRRSLDEVEKLALCAKSDGVNLDNDEAANMTLGSIREGISEHRSADVKVFLEGLARDCCESIPNGSTVDSLSAHAELCRDDEDGGVEWRLPFR